MKPQLDSEFWDFVVDSLEESGTIRREQASLLYWSTDDEKREALSEAVSDETWNRVVGDVAEYMLDIVGVDDAVIPEVFNF
mgnify:CR=1 FL=1